MSVHITSDNLSKFNKRLHKALKEAFGDSVSLSQSAEMVARAAGFKTLHDLQTHLAPKTLPVAVTPLPQISDNPSTTWIERINADIRHYAATHPTSVVQHWRWRENEGTHSLDIVGDHASFKLVFGEDVMSYVDTELSCLKATEDDRTFIGDLARRFPTDPIEGQKMGLDMARFCKLPFMREGFYSIARSPKYTTALGDFSKYETVPNLGEALQQFAVVSSESFVADFANSHHQYLDIGHIAMNPKNVFDTWKEAVAYLQKHPDLLLVQRLVQGNKVWSSFYATAGQYTVDVKSVNGDNRVFGVGYNDAYDVVRCQGFLAALRKLIKDHNPYGCNEIEHQLWDEGFDFAHSYPFREKFWMKPQR